jgi:glycosyltransferase involved in cell wall biosynthesis
VIHTTDGTIDAALSWFASPHSGVSAHWLVGLDGQVIALVPEEHTAQHAGQVPCPHLGVLGDDPPNLVTIGIEFDDGGRPHDVVRPDAQYQAGASLLADISERWDIPLDGDHVLPHRLINPTKTCPGNLDLDWLVQLASAHRAGRARTERPLLAVLVPARNAASDLPGWFESVERFADVVVALDDGSTDDTADVLGSHPLVEVLLRNPVRPSYVGWDDAANRNRLLSATEPLAPHWVLFLDADERIPADDAAVLRDFLTTDALPGLAYGMRCYRMVDDLEHYDRHGLWVYRLFSFAPGQRVPEQRLHFVPVPTTIPANRRVRTTIRIQHIGSLTAARRSARFAKYLEADPAVEFQFSYDHILDEPGDIHRFEPRPRGLPVLEELARTPQLAEQAEAELSAPVLSAIVISRDDERRIERTVRSVVEQRCEHPFEVIVVTSGTDRTASIVRDRFPGVRVVELDHPALPGEARNAGLRLARGAYISFPGSHVELPAGSLAARIHAHDQGWAMVTGTTRNGNPTLAGWAAYFLDHSTVLPERGSHELDHPPAHCSYAAEPLLAVGGFPEDMRAGEDTWVNEVLFRAGYRTWRAADVELIHHNRSRSVGHLLRHHFERGRAQVQFARRMSPGPDADRQVREMLWAYPTRRLARIDQNVQAWGGDLMARYRRVRPLVRLGVLAAWIGAQVELRVPSRSTGVSGRLPMQKASSEPVAGERSPTEPFSAGSIGERSSPAGAIDQEAVDQYREVIVRAPGVRVPLHRPLRVRCDWPAPHRGARPIFLHHPKTAGTALLRILEREYAHQLHLRAYVPTEQWLHVLDGLTDEERRELAFVAGHMAFGVHRLLPGPNVYLTLLRDPVDRIVSHYHYSLAHRHHPARSRALEGVSSLEDYVRRSVFAGIVNNGQTRLLGSDVRAVARAADEATLERACAVLDRDDVIVGLQDRFDESLLLMVRSLGWGYPVIRRENVNPERPRVEDLPPETVELIREHNALDIQLYEYARRRFERDLAGLEGLDEELEVLRLAGRFRPPELVPSA